MGSSYLERTRGASITIRSETGVSSCSTAESTENTASYSWSLVSATDSMGEMIDESRDPRVLVIPRYALGFAGASYVFQLMADFGGVSNAANATGERVQRHSQRAPRHKQRPTLAINWVDATHKRAHTPHITVNGTHTRRKNSSQGYGREVFPVFTASFWPHEQADQHLSQRWRFLSPR